MINIGIPKLTKPPAICEKCGMRLPGVVALDAADVICFACTHPMTAPPPRQKRRPR